jgi:ParB family chromosome partitioning protein
MAEEAARSRLGRGLAALIGDVGEETAAVERARGQRRVPVEFLQPNPRNPRQSYSEVELDELAASIRARGIIQPIVARTLRGSADHYEIIAGERRWRAAQRAGMHDVPIVLFEASDREALELAIVENVQRTDLNPLEEAMGYQALEKFGHSQDDIARLIGKSRSHVANTLRLLTLPPPVRRSLEEGALSAGHARALLGAPDPAALAVEVVRRGLNVRATEALVRRRAAQPRQPQRTRDPDSMALEAELATALGLRVTLAPKQRGGSLTVHYATLDQLDRVLALLRGASR